MYYDRKIETMSLKQRENYYKSKIKETVAYAYKNSSFMKKRMDEINIHPNEIKGPEDLPKIPVTKKEEVREAQRLFPPFGGTLAVPITELGRIYMSPGPIYDPEYKNDDRKKEAKALYGAGFRPEDRVIVTFSFHLVPAGLLFDKALRKIGATVIPAGVGNTDLQVALLYDLQITGYIGTASFLETLINRAIEKGFYPQKHLPLKKAVLTGENVPDSLRKKFEHEYGIQTSQVYGTADLGLFAYECEHHSGMHICEEVFVEIVNPETGLPVAPGQIGEVVVTYFDKTFPMIRYGTGDLATMRKDLCPCGRTSPRLEKIVGRVGDSFKVRGMFIHEPQVVEFIEKTKEIQKAILIIERKNHRDWLLLKAEPTNQNTNEKEVKEKIEKNFQEICRLRIDQIEFHPKDTLGDVEEVLIDKRKWE